VGHDDVQRDQVEQPGDVGEWPGDSGGGDREPPIEAGLPAPGGPGAVMVRPSSDQSGEDRAAEEQCQRAADDVGNALRPIAARPEVDSVKRADHDDTESDREGQARDDVREQERTS
jgi:hypothetical protein